MGDDIEINATLVRRLLAAQFPRWADLPIVPVRSAGAVNAIHRPGDDMVVRIPIVPRYAADLEKEYHWLPRLAPHLPLTIPEPLALGNPSDGYPWHWCVYRWISGKTFSVDSIRSLREVATSLAGFITAMWRIDTAGGPPPRPPETLAQGDRYLRESIAASKGMIDGRAAIAAWDAALRLPPYDGAYVWIHGDLSRPGNLLVTGGRLSAVIDFGSASLHDPARDLIVAWTLFSGESRDAFRAALGVDDATWARGRAWTLIRANNIATYRDTNPVIVAEAQRAIAEVIADRAGD